MDKKTKNEIHRVSKVAKKISEINYDISEKNYEMYLKLQKILSELENGKRKL